MRRKKESLFTLGEPTHFLARRETKPALLRCIIVAILIGTLFTINLYTSKPLHPLTIWAANVVGLFWMTFGGHWLELVYVNFIANRFHTQFMQRLVRITLWFTVGGLIVLASSWTRTLFGFGAFAVRPLNWEIAGLFFILVQLVIHTVYYLFKQPSFWTHDG